MEWIYLHYPVKTFVGNFIIIGISVLELTKSLFNRSHCDHKNLIGLSKFCPSPSQNWGISILRYHVNKERTDGHMYISTDGRSDNPKKIIIHSTKNARKNQQETHAVLDWMTELSYQQLTASETATLTKLSRITGLSWSMISIIGLSSSCRWQSMKSQTVNSVIKLSCLLSRDLISIHLSLFDGHKQTSYFFEDGNGESAGAQLTGAEQYECQSLHSMQHIGMRAALCRHLDTWAGLQQLWH